MSCILCRSLCWCGQGGARRCCELDVAFLHQLLALWLKGFCSSVAELCVWQFCPCSWQITLQELLLGMVLGMVVVPGCSVWAHNSLHSHSWGVVCFSLTITLAKFVVFGFRDLLWERTLKGNFKNSWLPRTRGLGFHHSPVNSPSLEQHFPIRHCFSCATNHLNLWIWFQNLFFFCSPCLFWFIVLGS